MLLVYTYIFYPKVKCLFPVVQNNKEQNQIRHWSFDNIRRTKFVH